MEYQGSQVSEAIRMIEISGRALVVSGKVLHKGFLMFCKLLNTLYLAKWKGKSHLTRLRKVKGESLSFFQIDSEKRADLKKIEKQLTKHGIMYAKLPDLCGGDGKTQYAFSPSDAEKVKLFMQNYQNGYIESDGKRNNIKFSLINGEDYERTGYTKNGEKTKEYKDLEKEARKEEKKQDTQKKRTADHSSQARISYHQSPQRFIHESLKYDPSYQVLPLHRTMLIESKETHTVEFEKSNSSVVTRNGSKEFLVMISIPQESLALVLTKADLGEEGKNGMHTAFLKPDKEYWVINKKILQKRKIAGSEVVKMFKKTSPQEDLAKMKNLIKNKTAVKADRFSSRKNMKM